MITSGLLTSVDDRNDGEPRRREDVLADAVGGDAREVCVVTIESDGFDAQDRPLRHVVHHISRTANNNNNIKQGKCKFLTSSGRTQKLSSTKAINCEQKL